jgi:hypothetical protein
LLHTKIRAESIEGQAATVSTVISTIVEINSDPLSNEACLKALCDLTILQLRAYDTVVRELDSEQSAVAVDMLQQPLDLFASSIVTLLGDDESALAQSPWRKEKFYLMQIGDDSLQVVIGFLRKEECAMVSRVSKKFNSFSSQ